MSVSQNAEQTANAVVAVLQASPSPAQTEEVSKLIEQAILNAILEERERCTHVVMECCSADLDMAHKMSEEIRKRQEALVTNLSSMR